MYSDDYNEESRNSKVFPLFKHQFCLSSMKDSETDAREKLHSLSNLVTLERT